MTDFSENLPKLLSPEFQAEGYNKDHDDSSFQQELFHLHNRDSRAGDLIISMDLLVNDCCMTAECELRERNELLSKSTNRKVTTEKHELIISGDADAARDLRTMMQPDAYTAAPEYGAVSTAQFQNR